MTERAPQRTSRLTQHDHEVAQQERRSVPGPQPLHLGQPGTALAELGVLVLASRRSEEQQTHEHKEN